MQFKAGFGLSNRHIQTLYASLFRKNIELDFEIERFELSDGDFLDCYWLDKPKVEEKKPIVVLFHGLAGSYKSPYIQGAMKELSKAGFASVIMHFRGCSGVENRLARAYHSGETQDAKEWIKHLQKNFLNSTLFAIGYSIGGNMLLKLLGEMQEDSPFKSAISVSAPLQLDICADTMDKGFSKFYQKHLLKSLNTSLEEKYKKHDMNSLLSLKKEDVKNLKTFWEFDDSYTAPIHGFHSAKDYYTRCSAKQFLASIKTPTLIIHASDDPFMTPEMLPNDDEISSFVELEIYPNGGHVGFISGNLCKPCYWLDDRVVRCFLEFKDS